ncbi:hypothetical protein [Paenibacillus soyae]|uniref:Uncharacterized protein n=1 Tax=Paenibacillus soyae TaxID=2969249 RepID=A0A9X2MUJ5_9BACL|nr:hypothetical protein [Paenibacillus soyae]MCR2807129.1 hypothetical protein [Paenibacillus soyae]
MIRASISHDQMMAMGDRELAAACFSPMIRAYKEAESVGESFAETGYGTLTRGQQALFAFWAYRTHAEHSEADLYWWTAYFMAQPRRWDSVKAGLGYFGDIGTIGVLQEMEAELAQRGHPRSLAGFDVSFDDLYGDPKLAGIAARLYGRLLEALPATTAVVAGYIRAHASEFIA